MTEDTIKLMDRLQCMRDNNFKLQEIIENLQEKKDECCQYNFITLRGEPITLRGERLTLG